MRYILFHLLLFAALLFLPQQVLGQFVPTEETSVSNKGTKTDSIPPVKRSDPHWQYANNLLLDKDTFYKWDSSFPLIQRYNRIHASGLPYVDLGNTGSPQTVLRYSPFVSSGFNTGLNPYSVQNKNIDSFKFYKAAVPFTRFAYTQGSHGVFILDALHTQNFSSNWNVTLELSSVQNQEVYIGSKQNHLHRGTMAGSHYKNRKGNYTQTVVVSWNRGRRAETRGLFNDTLFFRPAKGMQRKVGNFTPESVSAKSFYAQRHHYLEQRFYPGQQRNFSFFHRFDWIKEKYEYNESAGTFSTADNAFYTQGPNFTQGSFKDSSVWVQWNNSFGIFTHLKSTRKLIGLKAWYALDRIAYNGIYKTSASTTFNQSIHGLITADGDRLRTLAKAEIYTGGWNKGNYNAEIELNYQIIKNAGFGGAYRSQLYRPVFISERYSSNYLQVYSNRLLTAANALQVHVWYRSKWISALGNVSSGTASDALYLDTNGNFAQVSRINFVNFTGQFGLHFGKIHLTQKFTVQSHSQMEKIPVPAYTGISSIYLEGELFKKAMHARAGIDVWYSSSYKGYRYQPLNATFFPSQTLTGNYPYADLYFSGSVKTVMFYLKLEHWNQFLDNYGFENKYYSAIPYPNEPLQFRFGIVWKFYN